MSNISRAILASLTAAIITFVLTVVIAAIIDYAWVHGSSDPSRFDTLAWLFIYIWPFLVIQLFIPAIIVGIVAGVFSKLSRKQRIRSWAAATITFVLTVVIAAMTSYAWIHGNSDPSRVDTLAWMFIGWPILASPLFIPAIIVGIVAAIFQDTAEDHIGGGRSLSESIDGRIAFAKATSPCSTCVVCRKHTRGTFPWGPDTHIIEHRQAASCVGVVNDIKAAKDQNNE